MAEAEGLAHRVAGHDVHFHEVGVIDSFIDVVGSILGCHLLQVTRVTASAVNVGAGTIQTSHGLLPVPGPAVAALAKDIPIYSDGPNTGLCRMLGYQKEELRGKEARLLGTRKDLDVEPYYSSHLAQGDSLEVETEILRRDGRPLPVWGKLVRLAEPKNRRHPYDHLLPRHRRPPEDRRDER